MFLLLVELHARPSAAAEVESLLSGLASVAREEHGNLIYGVHRQQEDQNVFVLYELYKDRAAWDSHLALEAVQQALQQFDRLLSAAPRLVFCDTVALSGL